jgi:hypothetical protein
LPKVLQTAITSADIQKQLRQLSDTNKLHVDQWQLLQNEVLLTLLGFQAPEELADNLKADLDISTEVAIELAAKTSEIVFQPIRAELERELEHPDAQAAQVSGVEAAGQEELRQRSDSEMRKAESDGPLPAPPSAPAVAPGTPPKAAPESTVVRAPISDAYRPGETSAARKSVDDDPYRESPA